MYQVCDNKKSLLVRTENGSLPQSSIVSFLGVELDDRLNWVPHIEKLSNKLSSAYYALYHLRSSVGLPVLRTFYFAYVHSRLNYGLLAWGCSTFSNKIFVLQKKMIRCMLFLTSRTSCKQYFKELHILTLPSLYIYELIKFYYRNSEKFSTNASVSRTAMKTRGSDNLSVPLHRLSLYEKGPYYAAIKAYNALPDHLKQRQVNGRYYDDLKQYLINKSFYSLNEFLSS